MLKKIFASLISRPVKNFNLENRAWRVTQKKGSVIPPVHETTANAIKEFAKENPELYDAQKIKDENLVDMMQTLTVEAEKLPDIQKRNLPLSHMPAVDPYFEEVPVQAPTPEGKCTLKDAMSFIFDHQYKQGDTHSAKDIAEKYRLNIKEVEHVLTYYRTFRIVYPEKKEELRKEKIPDSYQSPEEISQTHVLPSGADIEEQRKLLHDASDVYKKGKTIEQNRREIEQNIKRDQKELEPAFDVDIDLSKDDNFQTCTLSEEEAKANKFGSGPISKAIKNLKETQKERQQQKNNES